MKFYQGKYTPINPDKYVGDVTNIQYRSGWEKKAMIFFDTTPSILKWNSEEVVVPYISPVDGKAHRYFPDFLVQYQTKTGEIKKMMVEIKPLAQCNPPKQKKQTKRMINEVATYLVNQAKWAAAELYCKKHGLEFKVLTERDLGITK